MAVCLGDHALASAGVTWAVSTDAGAMGTGCSWHLLEGGKILSELGKKRYRAVLNSNSKRLRS